MRLLFLTSILCVTTCLGYAQSLAELEATSKGRPGDFDKILVSEREMHLGVLRLIETDALKSGEEFRRAGLLQLGANEHKQEILSTGYQLLLTAVALGDPEAEKSIGRAWDGLLMATGRYRRIGATKVPIKIERGDSWWVDPAPALIRRVITDPVQARKLAFDSKDNPEVQQLVDADQKVREDWSHLTSKQLKKIMGDDRARFHRIKQIVDEGVLRTAKDFANAALVCQHGEVFLDYALAHELTICSILLGNKDAIWLAGASYDRMLLSAGYPQAFDTQFIGSWHLREFTTEGINDRMRKAVVHMTLAQSQDREKHPPKTEKI